MSITFKEVENKELFSNKTLNILEDTCICGNKLQFTDSLKQLICLNTNCINYIINRVQRMCKDLDIDIHNKDIQTLVKKLNIVTPYQMFMIELALKNNLINNQDIQNIELIVQYIKNKQSNEYLLYEVVKMCGIQTIEIIAEKIFKGFLNVDEAYEEIESGQVSFINERLGIDRSDSSIISVEIYNKLINIKEELLFGETQLTIKNDTRKKIKIAFCDSAIPFLNKTECLDYLNYTFNTEFVLVTTITESTDIIVKNGYSITNKYRAARLINDKYTAHMMNNSLLSLKDIGKFSKGEIKPLGSKIYIDSLENILNRLKECGV